MTEENPTLGPALDFLRLLWAVDHGLQSRSKRMEAESGVTGPQRLVLRLLGKFPKSSAGKIAEMLHVHPSTLTGILKRLEAKGFLTRKEDPVDKRRAVFALSKSGTAVNDSKATTVETTVKKARKRANSKDVEAAQRVLQIISEELEKEP